MKKRSWLAAQWVSCLWLAACSGTPVLPSDVAMPPDIAPMPVPAPPAPRPTVSAPPAAVFTPVPVTASAPPPPPPPRDVGVSKGSGHLALPVAERGAHTVPSGAVHHIIKEAALPEQDPPSTTPSPVNAHTLAANYIAKVSATEKLHYPSDTGELRVWIGLKDEAPNTRPGFVENTVNLKGMGQFVKIKPYFSGAKVKLDPSSPQDVCQKVSPTGTHVRFKFFPLEKGVVTAGADINMYTQEGCTDTPIPKLAESVSVQVDVDYFKLIMAPIDEMLSRTWKAFLDFWDKLLILVFGCGLFLVRKQLFEKFGFKEGADK